MGNTCKSMADSCQCMTKPLQYCKVISLQLIKINGKKKRKVRPLLNKMMFYLQKKKEKPDSNGFRKEQEMKKQIRGQV